MKYLLLYKTFLFEKKYKKVKTKLFGGMKMKKGIFSDKAKENGYNKPLDFAKDIMKDPEKWKKKLNDEDIVKQASLCITLSKMKKKKNAD